MLFINSNALHTGSGGVHWAEQNVPKEKYIRTFLKTTELKKTYNMETVK